VVGDRRGDAVLERQRPGYPVAGLANSVQHDLLWVYVGATEEEVHNGGDHMFPVVQASKQRRCSAKVYLSSAAGSFVPSTTDSAIA
jgi:hypothetical protein